MSMGKLSIMFGGKILVQLLMCLFRFFMTVKSRIFMLKMNSEKRNNTHVVMSTVCPIPE